MEHRKRVLSSQLFSSILEDDLGSAEHLLKMGADPNLLLTTFGMMPFHVAVGEINRPELFTTLLLDYSADPNVRSTEGLTPLHVACIYDNCQCVDMLMHYGGDPYINDQEGKNSFWCVGQSQCVRCRWALKKYSGCQMEEQTADEHESMYDAAFHKSGSPLESSSGSSEGEMNTANYGDSRLRGNYSSALGDRSDSLVVSEESDTIALDYDRLSTVVEETEDESVSSGSRGKHSSKWGKTSDPLEKVVKPSTPVYASRSHESQSGLLFPSIFNHNHRNRSLESSPTDSLSPVSSPEQPESPVLVIDDRRLDPLDRRYTGTAHKTVCPKPSSQSESPPTPDQFDTIRTASDDSFVTCENLYYKERENEKNQEDTPEILHDSPSHITLTPENFVLYESDCSIQSYLPSVVNSDDLSLSGNSSIQVPSTYSWTLSQFFKNMSLAKDTVTDKTVCEDKCSEEENLKENLNQCGAEVSSPNDERKNKTASIKYHYRESVGPRDLNATLPVITDDESVCHEGFYHMHDYAVRRGSSGTVNPINMAQIQKKEANQDFMDDSGVFISFVQPKSSSRNCTNVSLFDASYSTIKDTSPSNINRSGTKKSELMRPESETIVTSPYSCQPTLLVRPFLSDGDNQWTDHPCDGYNYTRPNSTMESWHEKPVTQPQCSSRNCAADSYLFDASCSAILDGTQHYTSPHNRSASRKSQLILNNDKPVQTSPLTEAALKAHQKTLGKEKDPISRAKICGSVRSTAGSVRTTDSHCSCQSTATVRHVQSDNEADSVVLVETHLHVTGQPCDAHHSPMNSTTLTWQELPHTLRRDNLDATMKIIRDYSTQKLRAELEKYGDSPGPITTATRTVYERRLNQLRKDPSIARITNTATYSTELEQGLSLKLNISELQELEDKMSEPFHRPDPLRNWREGTSKSSFIYLLLDPRVTKNLPNRAKQLGDEESFRIFIRSIFYVGKGKRARPYAHFKEAIKHDPNKTPGKKVGHILSIWNEGEGVVSLHIFQSIMAVEAYTREAAIIDAIGISRLTNVKLGDYYGPTCTWTAKKKRLLGVRLLKKAFRIFLSEGERQIRPSDLKV